MTSPAREQSATKARPPRLSLAGSAARSPLSPNQEGSSQSCATTRARFRGASRPLREAGDPPAGRTHQPQLARSSPTWSELRPGSTRRCLSPLGTLQPLAFGAGAQSSAHRRDPPATPSSQLRSAGAGTWLEARGTRHEARGPGEDAPRARADHGARLAWARGEGSLHREQLLLPISLWFPAKEEKHEFPAVSFSCRRGAWTPVRTSE